jgi:phospholipid transport system substrate-binding protein
MICKRYRNRIIRRLLYVILFLLAAGQYVSAGNKDPNDPNVLLRTKWDTISSILQNKDVDSKEKEKQINKVARPIFDFPLMAKLSLGKKNWSKFNLQQRKRFTELFVEKLSTSYCEKIMLYTDERVLFKPAVQKKKTIYIPIELKSKDKTIAIVYKLRKLDKHWKIYDVEIEGVSILLTYRSQFDDILRRGTVEELLSLLEKPPKQTEP